MTDESIINLSDETKSSLRIYATMAGFFIMAAVFLYGLIAAINGQPAASASVKIFGSALLLTIGVVLAMLHKRDLFAAFFILFAFIEMIHAINNALSLGLPIAIIYIIAALAFAQTRNEQRYAVVGLLLIRAISALMLFSEQFLVAQCAIGIMIIACFYFAFVLACERYKLPLRDMLVVDEDVPENDGVPVHFKQMGSSIGYLLFDLFLLLLIEMSFEPLSFDPVILENALFVMGIVFLIVGMIMMVAGRMKGTPFYFICIGFVFFMMSAASSWVPGVCLIIFGIMIMMREDSRTLLGLGIFLAGVAFALGASTGELAIGSIIAFVAFLIFTYLVFAVNSNGKLKLI